MVTAPLRADARSLILLAVNNNEDVTRANGGSHWSLLAMRRASDGAVAFRHYDSLSRSGNAAVAARVAQTLAAALGLGRARVEAAPAPQQANGYDCALHALLTAQLLCTNAAREPTPQELQTHVTPAAATALRSEMSALIARLAAEEIDKEWSD